MKFLSALKRGWMKFAEALGYVNSRIILTLVFIVFFGIYMVIFSIKKLFSRNPSPETYWIEKKRSSDTLEALTHQF